MKELEYKAIAWIEMKPDVYSGDNLDEVKAQWSSYFDGDKDGESGMETFDLVASRYPAGTKITIEVPMCPEEDCELDAEWAKNGICPCGFDWNEWVEGEYS